MYRNARCMSASIAAIAAVAFAVTAPAAEAQAVREFHLPAQPLSDALRAVSTESGINVLFDPSLVAGRVAPALEVQLTPDAAISRLLAGTELKHEFITERTVVVASVGGSHLDTRAVRAADPTRPLDHSGFQRVQSQSSRAQELAATTGVSRRQEPAENESAEEIQEIVVTGTHIRGVNPDTSPLTIYGREEIARTGVATVSDFMRTIPQNFALVDSDTRGNSGNNFQAAQNVSFGTGVNLHGLGSGSTLVLLNGHRLAAAGDDASFVDVSLIPLSAIQRVEVLSDGASAVYGADAVAGVVNLVLRRDYEGAESAVRYGSTSDGGATQVTASQLLGTFWSGGNGFLSYEYDDQRGLDARDREFIPDQGGPYFLLPKQRRHSVFAAGHQTLSPSTELHLDGFYSQRDFLQDITFLGLPSHTGGDAKQSSIVLSLDQGLSREWRGTVGVNYSRNEQRLEQSLGDLALPKAAYRAQLLSGELKADGPAFAIASGDVRTSVGVSVRSEKFDDLRESGLGIVGEGLRRTVSSVFGEALVPLARESNAALSLAARFDHYSDFGSATTPKVGVRWTPARGTNLRASYARSFRAPPLAQVSDGGQFYQLTAYPNPNSPSGFTNTLVTGAPGNPDLRAERARSFSAGVDVRPTEAGSLALSLTYFNVRYRDRLSLPPVPGGPPNVFSYLDQNASFLNLSPTAADVQAVYDNFTVLDFLGIGAENVQATFDNRLHNIATTRTSGIDLQVTDSLQSTFGRFDLFIGAAYLFEMDLQPVRNASSVDLINTVYNPADLRGRAGVTWNARGFSSSLMANYSPRYDNNLTDPVGRVGSWLTFDVLAKYELSGSAALQGLALTLAVQNVANREPPRVDSDNPFANFGYDPTNANPRGRAIAVGLSKRWGSR